LTLRKWFHLFWTTLFIGIGLGVVAGLYLQLTDQDVSFLGLPAIGFNIANMALGGAMISVLSQMGFFAYLIVRYIAMGIIRSKTLWDLLQLAIVIVALFDLAYLRYINFPGNVSFLSYSFLPLILLVISLGTAYWKMKLTNKSGFIPTLFFMAAVTVMEGVPAFKLNNSASNLFMLLPLIGCNAWQILILPRVLQPKKS
jgi:KinB signaling pathway activation protein